MCGLGLLALSWGRARLEVVCGIVVATIGLLTLYEYLFGLNLGLDQEKSEAAGGFHDGRTVLFAAITALAVGLLTGLAPAL